ncbi:PRKR-interacting protein 1 [Babesia ovis]|uniref:PRKR-interacting protein 1 n=1 Tax=Babesia ovis TaxID=5869 RepID=A0A9W5TB75_BABOV|nr:PRKR-interacting protein 1 [Babesia ovis]
MPLNERLVLADGNAVIVPLEASHQEEDENEEAQIERMHNVWGSSSGARSDFLGIYCKHRSAENERLQNQEKEWEQETANKVFQTIRYARMQKEIQKTAKRRERRVKKKNKQQTKNRQTHVVVSESSSKVNGNKDNIAQKLESVDEGKTNTVGSNDAKGIAAETKAPKIIIEEDVLECP